MTIREYLIELEEELKFLPKNKRESTLIVYREKINNLIDLGESEEKIIAELPSPREIAESQYSSEGIDYLDKRKKLTKQKATTKAIISAFVLLLLVSAVVVLSWFTFGSIIKIVGLIFKVKGILEIVINTCLVISYIAVLLLAYIYLLDLLHMIFNMLLENILIVFDKNPKFLDNSLMDYVDKITKKPKLFGKILAVTAGCLLMFLVIGYFTKTYFYRSFGEIKTEEYVETLTYNNSTFDKFVIDIDTANIVLSTGEEFKMIVSSEFERNNLLTLTDSTLTFTTDTLQEFDMFGLFTEPIPYIEITVPQNLNIICKTQSGFIQMEKSNLNDLTIQTNSSGVFISESSMNKVNISQNKGGLQISNSNFNIGSINTIGGSVLLEKNTCVELNYINDTAKVNINDTVLDKLTLKSNTGNVFINKMNNNETYIETQNCTLDLKQVHSSSNINIKSFYETKVTLYESDTTNLNVIMNGGTFTGYYLNMNGVIQTTGSLMLSYITGNFDVEAYGRYCDIHEYIGDTLKLRTESSETTLKYIKANLVDYQSNKSKSLLYFVFGKDMIVQDIKGDILLDNRIAICDNLELYSKYEQKVERLDIPSTASFNVNEGVQLGAWE